MNKKKIDKIKFLGYIAVILGLVADRVSDYVSDKQLDDRIDEKIRELSKKNEDEES